MLNQRVSGRARRRSRRALPFGRELVASLILLSITALSLFSVRTVATGGEIAGWDHSFHYTNAYLTHYFFLPEGSPLGYDPWHMFGWSPNLYYNLGTTLFVALFSSFLSPLLGTKSVYSLCVALSYALLAPATFILAYAMTGSHAAGLVAALVSVAVFDEEDSWISAGWRQVHYIGMWPQRWGIVTGLSALGLLVHAFRRGRADAPGFLLASLAALLLAWATLSHVVMGAATLILMLVAAVFKLAGDAAAREYGKALNAACLLLFTITLHFGLIAFWAVPLLETNREFHGLHTLTWELGVWVVGAVTSSYPLYFNGLIPLGPLLPLLRQREKRASTWALYTGWLLPTLTVLFAPRAIPSSMIGSLSIYATLLALALYLKTRGSLAHILLPTSAALLLWLATGPSTYVVNLFGLPLDLRKLPLVEWLGYGKFAGYARYILLAYYSVTVSSLASWAVDHLRSGGDHGASELRTAALLLLSLLVAGFLGPVMQSFPKNTDLLFSSGSKKFRLIEEFPLYQNVSLFLDSIGSLGIEDNTYLLVQDLSDNFADWSTFCHNHFVYEFPLYIGKPIVGGIVWTRYVTQPLSTTEYSRMFSVDNGYWAENVETFYSQLEELGISYVAVFDSRLKDSLKRSELFEEVLSVPPYALFRTREFNQIITINSSSARIESVVIRPNLIRFTIRAKPMEVYRVRIRLVAFPHWTVVTQPEALLFKVSTYNPRVVEETSRAWGYPVGSKIPFFDILVVPMSEVTTVELKYNPRTTGDLITALALLVVGAVAAISFVSRLVSSKLFIRGLSRQRY